MVIRVYEAYSFVQWLFEYGSKVQSQFFTRFFRHRWRVFRKLYFVLLRESIFEIHSCIFLERINKVEIWNKYWLDGHKFALQI